MEWKKSTESAFPLDGAVNWKIKCKVKQKESPFQEHIAMQEWLHLHTLTVQVCFLKDGNANLCFMYLDIKPT